MMKIKEIEKIKSVAGLLIFLGHEKIIKWNNFCYKLDALNNTLNCTPINEICWRESTMNIGELISHFDELVYCRYEYE